jgi:hypothetical protein
MLQIANVYAGRNPYTLCVQSKHSGGHTSKTCSAPCDTETALTEAVDRVAQITLSARMRMAVSPGDRTLARAKDLRGLQRRSGQVYEDLRGEPLRAPSSASMPVAANRRRGRTTFVSSFNDTRSARHMQPIDATTVPS